MFFCTKVSLNSFSLQEFLSTLFLYKSFSQIFFSTRVSTLFLYKSFSQAFFSTRVSLNSFSLQVFLSNLFLYKCFSQLFFSTSVSLNSFSLQVFLSTLFHLIRSRLPFILYFPCFSVRWNGPAHYNNFQVTTLNLEREWRIQQRFFLVGTRSILVGTCSILHWINC
jgi:hypothetical protein